MPAMLALVLGFGRGIWDRACHCPRGILLPVRCQECRQRGDLSSYLYKALTQEGQEAEAE